MTITEKQVIDAVHSLNIENLSMATKLLVDNLKYVTLSLFIELQKTNTQYLEVLNYLSTLHKIISKIDPLAYESER